MATRETSRPSAIAGSLPVDLFVCFSDVGHLPYGGKGRRGSCVPSWRRRRSANAYLQEAEAAATQPLLSDESDGASDVGGHLAPGAGVVRMVAAVGVPRDDPQ